MKNKIVRFIGGSVLAAVSVTGCAGMSSQGSMQSHSMHDATMMNSKESATSAADLRVGLNSLLGEHILIAAVATSHALGGRDAAFKGAVWRFRCQLYRYFKAIGSVYGPDAEKALLPLWRKHIGFLRRLTITGVATKDKAKQDKAVVDLVSYSEDFAAFLSSANPNLPKSAVTELVKGHILTLKAVVDAQAAGDWPKAYAATRSAYGHMHMIGDPLAGAIAKQFPQKFTGAVDSPAANLRNTLNLALREHAIIAAMATGFGTRWPRCRVQSSRWSVGRQLRGYFQGDRLGLRADAEKAFLPLWRKHIVSWSTIPLVSRRRTRPTG
jgi:hypothetical protein